MIDKDLLRRLGIEPVDRDGREWWWLDPERGWGVYYGPAPQSDAGARYLCGHTASEADILPHIARLVGDAIDEATAEAVAGDDW